MMHPIHALTTTRLAFSRWLPSLMMTCLVTVTSGCLNRHDNTAKGCLTPPNYTEVKAIQESGDDAGAFSSLVVFEKFNPTDVTLVSANAQTSTSSSETAYLNFLGFFPPGTEIESSLNTKEFQALKPLKFLDLLTEGEHYEVLSIPEGLTLEIRVGNKPDQVVAQLKGSATQHASTDSANIVIVFKKYFEYNLGYIGGKAVYEIYENDYATVKTIALTFQDA